MCENIYISPAGEESLKTFKYKGGSDSFLYEHLWGPLSQFIAENILPSWLAPNLITLTGFAGVILSQAFIQYHSWDYATDVPPWTLYFSTFSILFYQILDNVDGKQARRTGSSSPLGMLFDHGCDTTTTWVIGLMVANCLQLGNSNFMFFGLLFMAFLGFFFPMWFQYHIGFVKLERINAIDEGLVFVESLFLVSAVFGQSIWHTRIYIIDIQINEFIILITALGAFFQCVDHFRTVVREKSLFTALSTLRLPLDLIIVFTITAIYSPSNVVKEYAYLYIYGFGFMWSKMVGHLQLCHIVNEKIKQSEPTWVAICIIQILNVLIGYNYGGKCIINELLLVRIIIVFAFILYMHFCVCVSLHISRVLNIGILTIKKKQQINLPVHLQINNHGETELKLTD